ncbi:BsuBI/PstI restriction endonuclease C-terminus [Alkalithermobacter thermoalcaliphilus JW-YL-7 = DSM 7308]|uniref:BsuBI/PstI restriction endonuclease C-terminus n=1 Tax=Alkalithermobacter thermoalcaliphilus JW-YL-7 = DSM 7308 TaxID=1121328 RepID=A0A150FPC9_CLOPD|nr:Type II site-specific deoxyribonuclease [[Clostridium] paradoxum JW-YL-7 = DSM 7308]SHK49649.1 BsuBI/PstI restriction endonuclease C-terminus [[Clostridium] paradoxum JW-YL-7 = DSM 7308]
MIKIEEAKEVLRLLGLPKRQQNDRSAYTLLALLNLKQNDNWTDATINLIGIHEIIVFIAKEYNFEYAENSRESIRRQTIHQLEQAGIIERNADDPTRPTNSGKTVYSITPEALDVIKSYGTDKWETKLEKFLQNKEKLAEKYLMKRQIHQIPVKIDTDEELIFSPGEHNELQKLIIEEFGSRFAKGSKLLYVGDTADKNLYRLDKELEAIGIPFVEQDKLPDVVLYNKDKNWIFLCEAVTSHGPISPKRFIELEEMLKDCTAGKIYVTCFLDMSTFKRYADEIAWETEVWIAEMPDHLLHYNGDRFMGPRD